MIRQPVGIRSLAVSFPSIRRTNDYYRENYPKLIEKTRQETLAKVFSATESTSDSREFDQEMMPYLSDPFRGTVERWILGPGESSLTLEYRAASDALRAANLSPEEVDLMLVASMQPEQIGIGNASFLCRQLGLRGAAWNIESMQSAALVGLQTACTFIRAGEYRNVLVVVSCTYSRFLDEDDTLSWFLGDGAGAFVVGSLEADQGILGTKIIHTAATCDAYSYQLTKDMQDNPRICLQAGKSMSKLIRDHTKRFLCDCIEGTAAAACLTLNQIDFFVFSTPF
ncbi:MAG: 3-oxoacyl-ACP synthase, partial [Symploca sp. SIO1C4]|nr:3-oxoacyl-ACP synthase [Symploca sp. SIO1C4]